MFHSLFIGRAVRATVIAGLVSAIIVVAKSNVQKLSELTPGPTVGVAEVVMQKTQMMQHLLNDNSVDGK